MENDLVSIYENNYLTGNVLEEKKGRAVEADAEKDEKISKYESKRGSSFGGKKKTKFSFKKKGTKKKSMSKENIGGITYDSFNRSENIFDKILREMDEMNGNMDSSVGNEDDNVFDADSESSNDEEVSYTISELRAMTLGEIAELLHESGEGEDEEDEYGYGDESGEMETGDSIPNESYGFTGGESNYKGDQGTYDGKAKRQAPTTRVKSNGDADFSQSETGYDPEDTEGSEGSYYGDQGTYDGKAKRQAPTTFVKSNGDADFGKSKTGTKTSSGKKDKNYF